MAIIDNFTNLKTNIMTNISNLKTQLTDKGVECSDINNMPILISKIAEIQAGGGGEYPEWFSGQGVWSNAPADMLVSQYFSACCEVGDRIYITGMYNGVGAGQIYYLDTTTNTWYEGTRYPDSAIDQCTAQAIGEDIYCFGRYDIGTANNNKITLKYNTVTETWTQMANSTYAISKARSCVLNGFIHVQGGWNPTNTASFTSRHYKYDPATDTFTTCTAKRAIIEHGMETLGGFIYIFGGANSSGTVVGYTDCYDAETNTWTAMKTVTTADRVCSFGSAVLNGKIYVFGGTTTYDNTSYRTDMIQTYDPVTNTWGKEGVMPETRMSHCAGTIGDITYIISGRPNIGSSTNYNSNVKAYYILP